ncbi:MAG: hypothetical protein V7720_04105 [Halioglobus sp.]
MLANPTASQSAASADDQSIQVLLRKLLPMCKLVASRGGAIAAQFAAQLVVGTMAGASGLGILQLYTSWTCIAGEILGMGLPTRAMRLISVAYAEQQGDVIRQLLRDARRKIVRLWLILATLAVVPFALLMSTGTAPDWTQYGWLLMGATLTAPLFALLRLYAESLKATGAALAAVTLESLTSPVALLLVSAFCWFTGQPLITITLLVTFSLSLVITPLALRSRLSFKLSKLAPTTASLSTSVVPRLTAPRAELLSLWGIGVLSIGFLNLPFIVLPIYADAAQIGVFSVAHKLVNVVTTLLLLLAAVFGPVFARQAAKSDANGLLSLLRRTQLVSIAVFLPVSLTLIVLANSLAKLFGEDFGDLRIYIVILTAGHLINAATGLAGIMLNMAGAASKELATLVVATIFALVASAWVGPEFGAIGLAWVFSASIALKNMASYALARHHLIKMREQL